MLTSRRAQRGGVLISEGASLSVLTSAVLEGETFQNRFDYLTFFWTFSAAALTSILPSRTLVS
jgi:hypothetical protein